jgi:membrane fusion protein (multidrug efflux system)
MRDIKSFERIGSARLGFLVLCGMMVVGCGSEEPVEESAAEILLPPVMVERVQRRDVVDQIRATGQLTAKADATIAAQVVGQITEVVVDEGQAVESGAVLLVIDPERRELEVANASAQLAEARAELAVAKRSYQRTKRLSKGNVASEARLDEDRTRESLARSATSGAEARLGLARRALADSTVRAPFSGLVARRHVSVGEYLTIGTALFDLVALDPIEVEFTLSEIDSSKVELGDPVEVSIAPYPDETFRATVSMISPTLDPRTRTLRVKAELPNPDGRIRPGLFAHSDLGVSERLGALVVPEDAVVERADGAVIFRVGPDDRAERIQVETGVSVDGWIEIRDGLAIGDRVIVRGQVRVDDGIMVSVRHADGALDESVVSEPALPAAAEGLASERTP